MAEKNPWVWWLLVSFGECSIFVDFVPILFISSVAQTIYDILRHGIVTGTGNLAAHTPLLPTSHRCDRFAVSRPTRLSVFGGLPVNQNFASSGIYRNSICQHGWVSTKSMFLQWHVTNGVGLIFIVCLRT